MTMSVAYLGILKIYEGNPLFFADTRAACPGHVGYFALIQCLSHEMSSTSEGGVLMIILFNRIANVLFLFSSISSSD